MDDQVSIEKVKYKGQIGQIAIRTVIYCLFAIIDAIAAYAEIFLEEGSTAPFDPPKFDPDVY